MRFNPQNLADPDDHNREAGSHQLFALCSEDRNREAGSHQLSAPCSEDRDAPMVFVGENVQEEGRERERKKKRMIEKRGCMKKTSTKKPRYL